MTIYSPTASRTAGRPSWLMAGLMILLTCSIAYRVGQHRPAQMQWSQYVAGPVLCISNGHDMQCAARSIVPLPPGFQPQPAPAPTAGDPQLSAQQLGCVALAVFGEARGEPYLGQAAVAQTVLNRSSKGGSTPCDVVTQVAQYQAVERMTDDPWREDAAAWERALEVATSVAGGDYDTGACRDAHAFHSGDAPRWAVKSRLVCRVGGHRFYADSEG